MTVSSRTPEGLPHQCPVCGNVAAIEPSFPGGDSVCPSCGHLLLWFRDRLASKMQIEPSMIRLETPIDELGVDSLETVELTMEVEEAFGIQLPNEVAERIRTPADLIRVIRRFQKQGPP